MTPPAPTTWKQRPTRRVAIFLATENSTEATVNATSDANKPLGRPKMSLSEAKYGIVAADAKRYDVPIQNTSVIVA